MRADASPLDTVLGEKQQWVVPVYQRHYAWKSDDEKQIPKLWEDLRDQVTGLLEGRTQFPHYFGAILFAEPANQPFGVVRQRYLVDGQQRITTFHLLLTAIREAAKHFGNDDLEDTINAYLFNEKNNAMRDPDREQFKLWPSSLDRKLFQDIVQTTPEELRTLHSFCFYKNGRLIKGRAPKLLQAFLYLYDQMVSFIDSRSEDEGNEETIRALLRSFLTGFQIVVIKLEENDDAQEIFASLNGMAEPLAPFDLIRNDVFHRARKMGEDDERLFDEKWKAFEQPFWNVMVKQGRFKKARADHFVGHAVVAETARDINVGKVATEYQHFARERKFASVADELDVLLAHGRTYRDLEETPKGAITNRIAEVLRIWDISTFHPLVLWINAQNISDDQKLELFSIVENYIIRREICGLSAKNYNKVVTGIIREAREAKDVCAAFKTQLSSLSGDASKMPQDAEVSTACEQYEAYGRISSQKLRYIFKNIEESIRTKFDEVMVLTSHLTIEHVMPQKWAEHWPLSNGLNAPSESVWSAIFKGHQLDDQMKALMQERERAVNTLGNLTLVTEALNPHISNGPWAKKREALGKSLLALNREIAEASIWDENAITKRAGRLSSSLIKIWPGISEGCAI